ncbi:MAG: hypothetical protein MAG551_00372 [Candidatus Scalindua arabica]|uniref:Uncharacterized protein n=1 Tax=Candidatus Scalindua arabica TaxID=1127984 RepID=A0A941VZP4_9BACT|nr:hypothetical protein [Candidatus Scalindua arabica]
MILEDFMEKLLDVISVEPQNDNMYITKKRLTNMSNVTPSFLLRF